MFAVNQAAGKNDGHTVTIYACLATNFWHCHKGSVDLVVIDDIYSIVPKCPMRAYCTVVVTIVGTRSVRGYVAPKDVLIPVNPHPHPLSCYPRRVHSQVNNILSPVMIR